MKNIVWSIYDVFCQFLFSKFARIRSLVARFRNYAIPIFTDTLLTSKCSLYFVWNSTYNRHLERKVKFIWSMPKNLTNKIYKNMKTGSFVNSHFFCFFVFCHKEYENKGETQLYDSFDFFFRTQIFICMQSR